MKKIIIALLILCALVIPTLAIPASADLANPYNVASGSGITSVTVSTNKLLKNEVQYFESSVTTNRYASSSNTATLNTYGAIGGANTKLFVYSLGKNNDTDFKTATVKTLMQAFAEENPDWIPLAAINGDFFDMESSNTPGYGEPEGIMIQNGDVLKAHMMNVAGVGIVGIKSDGSMIFHANGFASDSTAYTNPTRYNIILSDSTNSTVVQEYANTYADRAPNASKPTFVTPDSDPVDLTGKTVYVIACDTYRYAYRGGTGHVADNGAHTYFFEGKVESVREGTANDKPAAGTVLVAVDPAMTNNPITVGSYVKGNAALNSQWKDVVNAFGFKQAILVNGNSSFVNTSSPSQSYVSDTSYVTYAANRTAKTIQFNPPLFLPIEIEKRTQCVCC